MEDITRHTHKILKTIRNPTSSISKKITEIILEIFIITFAVSLSQYLERQREQNVKQKEVKEFLLGLKNDMIADNDQAKDNITDYDNFKRAFSYLSNISFKNKPNKDSLDSGVEELTHSASFRPNISRFEGFKSSGKLEEILDKQLLQNILFYYEQAIPQLRASEGGWIGLHEKLAGFFIDNKVENEDGTNNSYHLIMKPMSRNLTKMLIPWPQLYERYNKIVTLTGTILKEIETNYPESKR
jgi:hypothetical protein